MSPDSRCRTGSARRLDSAWTKTLSVRAGAVERLARAQSSAGFPLYSAAGRDRRLALAQGGNMTQRRGTAFVMGVLSVVISLATQAHHGTTVTYDHTKTIKLNGTVTEWDFVFPHSALYFEV